jgi:hypothetical protein
MENAFCSVVAYENERTVKISQITWDTAPDGQDDFTVFVISGSGILVGGQLKEDGIVKGEKISYVGRHYESDDSS